MTSLGDVTTLFIDDKISLALCILSAVINTLSIFPPGSLFTLPEETSF
jgi:hypothetical protein